MINSVITVMTETIRFRLFYRVTSLKIKFHCLELNDNQFDNRLKTAKHDREITTYVNQIFRASDKCQLKLIMRPKSQRFPYSFNTANRQIKPHIYYRQVHLTMTARRKFFFYNDELDDGHWLIVGFTMYTLS